MIGWVLYAIGIAILAAAALVNNEGDPTGSLVVTGIGLLVAAIVYSLSKLDYN